jgi:methyl-accepting chemotaxis protein
MNFLIKSLKAKILLVLVLVFGLLITITTTITTINERSMVMDLAVDKTQQMTRTYFDNINTMMLSGTMGQRSVLREKLLENPGVTNVKVIRAEAVAKIFGTGNPEQVVTDDLDRQGLDAREPMVLKRENDNGRAVTVIIPMLASDNYKGTNCLNCHVVDKGTLLGTVRIDYSLAELDQSISENIWSLSLINIAVLTVGLFAITWYLGFVVLNPLVVIRNIMTRNAESQDLTQTINIDKDDEIGQVAKAFNSLLHHFSDSLGQVGNAVNHLTQSSSSISTSAEKTVQAANQQREETELVANSIAQLEQSANGLAVTAVDVANASSQADADAHEGTATTNKTIEGILKLVSSIENASDVIVQLNEQSEGVGAVLDVIKGIAEQTNLLALNAAIEAARAGEQGRGFAVVADEVRTLATRSHESTQEIERIIEQLQAGAKQAVEVMSQAKDQAEHRKSEVETADNSLKLIAQRVSEIHEMNEGMNQTVNSQSEITHNVQNNVSNISALSESTSTDAEQTSRQSEEIVRLARDLQELLNRFKY